MLNRTFTISQIYDRTYRIISPLYVTNKIHFDNILNNNQEATFLGYYKKMCDAIEEYHPDDYEISYFGVDRDLTHLKIIFTIDIPYNYWYKVFFDDLRIQIIRD